MWRDRLRLNTAPRIAAPRVLPRLREKMLDAVADPRSAQPTLSWMITIAAVDRNPIPSPITTDPAPATTGDDPAPSSTKAVAPTGSSAAPNSSVGRSPNRVKLRAASVAPIGQPSTIIVSANPATSVDRPSTPCTYIGRNVVSPITAMPLSSVAALAVAIGRRDHSRNAIIGSAARRSCHANSPALTRNPAPATHAVRASPSPACVSPTIRDATATVNSAAPATSTGRRSRTAPSRRNAMKLAAAASPTGTLIQKIQAQLRCWMISPPANGPSTDEMPHTLAR